MASSEFVWVLTALVILATVCIGVFKSILGDSVPFSRGPRDFLLDRLARRGDPFTISLLGRTYTIINSPETIKFVLSTAHASFSLAYPVQYTRLLNVKNTADGRHVHFRKALLSAASGDGLHKLFPFINSLAEKSVKSWENQAVVDLVEELRKFVFNTSMPIIWRNVETGSEEMDQIRNEVFSLEKGLAALPINFPGFSFHKAMKTKQALVSRIQSEISRRRKAGVQHDDLLGDLMSTGEVECSDYDICCSTVVLLYSASSTTAALIPWVLKYLEDFPEIRQRVQEEQDYLRQKMIEDKSLAWFKPKTSMPYTLQVVYETLRIEVLVVFPRQANKDVDYNGLIFYKDSYVWASAASLHYDPKYHPNPQEFDPSRFVEKPNPNAFLPFGQGPHLCPGSDLALVQTMLIIHHLVTNYRWKKCGLGKGMTRSPVSKLLDYPVCLVKRGMT